MTWLGRIALRPYGEFADLDVELGKGLTVVHGVNEAGKSTARDALVDFLCGIPPRSPRASTVARAKLAVEADVHHDGTATTWVRRATGVEPSDGDGAAVAPWNRDEPLDRTWWSTRYSIDHGSMREGGGAVLSAAKGASDIGELIFVARRGESAHRLADDLQKQCLGVYSGDGRNKTLMKAALKDLEESRARLRDTLTGADDVVSQQSAVRAAEQELSASQEEVTRTRRAMDLARAHDRIIRHVLAHIAADAELRELDAAGPRLSPEELAAFGEAVEGRARARAAAEKARRDVAVVMEQIAASEVDEALLAAAQDIEELAGGLQARLEGLDRADDQYRPEAERQEQALRGLLAGLGMDVAQGIGVALDAVRVPTDVAATLDDLADRLEAAEAERDQHRARHREALRRLAERGVQPDLEGSRTVPGPEAKDAERAIRAADRAVAAASDALTRLQDQAAEIRRALEVAEVETMVTREDVDAARGERDALWQIIRDDWLDEVHRQVDERRDLAGGLDRLLAMADGLGDREAEERSLRSASNARAEVHDGRLRTLAGEIDDQEAALRSSNVQRQEAEERWGLLWARAGIRPAPSLDLAPLVDEDLAVLHGETVEIGEADERVAELRVPWLETARDAGLPASATPATWRARSGELARIDQARAELERNRAAIDDVEARWEAFRARALEVLTALGQGAVAGDRHEIATAIRGLSARLSGQRDRQAKASALSEQLDARRLDELDAADEEHALQAVIDRLALEHAVDEEALALMAARAEQAAGPLERMETAVGAIRAAWPGAAPQQAIEDLRGSDEAAVSAELEQAERAHAAALEVASEAATRRGGEQEVLRALEARHGAGEALERVRAAEATVTELAGRWMRLRLQAELLGRVVASQGDDGVLPLLADAGRILDRFTGGRWVGLCPVAGHGARALQIVRSDGSAAGPDELSEGTLDQAFLALRLAAVRELHQQRRAAGRPDVPLILDDVLMAFDTDRTRAALEELADLAADMQIILFTHHAHVADLARGLDGVTVSDLPAPS